jgi:hypothetical protein
MSETSPRPTLTIYRRPGCHLCDDAEILLRDELAQRARAGHGPVTVERVDIAADPELEARYGARVPVFAINEDEADLVTSGRQVRDFLQRNIPGPA